MKLSHLFACILLFAPALPSEAQVTVNTLPSRVFGHPNLGSPTANPNLVLGRELATPQGMAIDTAADPKILYVADTGNNRILAWRNSAQFSNGAPADLIIGQPDRFSTNCGGPNRSSSCGGANSDSAGLYNPTGLAVDGQHNLYVVDSNNNRILRFLDPFGTTDHVPDMVIGQSGRGTGTANTGGISASTVALCCDGSGNSYRGSLAFDSQGNLYFTDAGNNRVLRYPVSVLQAGAASGPAADRVIGQPNFSTNSAPAATAANRAKKDVMRAPAGVTYDSSSGRLYVSDAISRVLVYGPNLPASGGSASRIMGISIAPAGQQVAPDTYLFGPAGVVMIGSNPAVLDAAASRIMIFPPVEQWPAETADNPSPRALAVNGLLGQNAFQLENSPNRNQPTPSSSSLYAPVSALFVNSELFVVDTGNNRVLVMPQQSGTFANASRVLGQVDFIYDAVNLIEGQELFLGNRGGMVVDQTAEPPHLYVADPYNNRVLGFRDARKVKYGATADLVIGQAGLYSDVVNYKNYDPTNDRNTPSASSLRAPTGLTLDSQGNLWVADSGNGRVLRFPKPFEKAQPNLPDADLVIGQPEFTTAPPFDLVTDSRMTEPYGLAFDADYGLFVSDRAANRVLFFPAPYTKGMHAAKVFGQPDFASKDPGTALNRMYSPAHVAVDSGGRLHVVDTNNNRILLFETGRLASDTNQFAQNTIIGLNRPLGIFISYLTGEIWVANTNSSRALRFPKFEDLNPTGQATATATVPTTAPLALTQDQYGTLYVADASNRIALYYPPVVAVNGASFKHPFTSRDSMMASFSTAIRNGTVSGSSGLLSQYPPLAPGMIASLFPLDISLGGTNFGPDTLVFNQLPNPLPLPRELADVQLLINDQPAPLFFVSPGQINFQVPSSAPSSGTVDVRVEKKSTGQVLGTGMIQMAQAAPGFFTAETSGSGQLMVLNGDGVTVNSAANPAKRGEVIEFFGTGQGLVPSLPPDGELTPGDSLVSTDAKPQVIMQPGPTSFLDDKYVEFSGLAPGLVGVWQVNVRIPDEVPPSNAVLVVFRYKGVTSNNTSVLDQIRTTIAVKQ